MARIIPATGSAYARIERRTLGVYDDGSARLLDLEFELPGSYVVRQGEKPGTVRIEAPRDQDSLRGDFDPALLADLAQRFEEIGS